MKFLPRTREPEGFFRRCAPIPPPPPSLNSAAPVLDPRSPNPDEISRIRRIPHDTQPQLLVDHAGSTDELLVDVHPAAPPTTLPSLHDSGRLLLAARVRSGTASRRRVYYTEKRYRGMKQVSRCAQQPATAIIALTERARGRLDVCNGDAPRVVISAA